jgi:hypothetical protein
MKKAAILVGSHFSGKSKTITKYFKPMIGLSGHQRNFSEGRVLSQSIEEKEVDGRVLSQSIEERVNESVKDFLSKYGDKKFLVCAARPPGESPSVFNALKTQLECDGFDVLTINIQKDQPESFYKGCAKRIYDHLRTYKANQSDAKTAARFCYTCWWR